MSGCVSHQSLINMELICVLSMLLCQSLPVDTLVRDYLCVTRVCRGVCISLIVDVCVCGGGVESRCVCGHMYVWIMCVRVCVCTDVLSLVYMGTSMLGCVCVGARAGCVCTDLPV